MPIIRCASTFALIALAGCAIPKPESTEWIRITTAMNQIPLGMEVQEIEQRLSLPIPFEAVLGSGTYHDRVFRYRVAPDIVLSLGLRHVGSEKESEKGMFRYSGHHSIHAGGDLAWNRWEFGHYGAPSEAWRGLAHLKPTLGDSWPPPGTVEARGDRAELGSPTPAALWANRQVEALLAGDVRQLAKQLQAIAVVEVDNSYASLRMNVLREELERLWKRVRTKYDTSWVSADMIESSRAMFVHTLLSLYVRDKAPALFDEMPGAFDSDAERWPAWLDAHNEHLGIE